jgi:membrane protease YdiL (CAAX protease family)
MADDGTMINFMENAMHLPTLRLTRFDEILVLAIAAHLTFECLPGRQALRVTDILMEVAFAAACIAWIRFDAGERARLTRDLASLPAACGLVLFGVTLYVTGDAGGKPLGTFMLMVLIAPVVEEFVFRSMPLHRHLEQDGYAWKGAGAALFYAIYQDWSGLLTGFVFGLAMAWLYKRTRSVWPCIVAHMLLNFAVFQANVTA